ncbi:MAG: 3-deoxy-manno-octulosonate cytidylyltransferase [Gammaproteobacteria bacterium]|nr:3-deoxy-manno-octulosonate cytidylyltransferase [Gammaproteobacteria bacterium]
MSVVAIIPARMNSSRFPGKPLEKIHGMPMIGHCLLRTQLCAELTDTYVATCDNEIYEYVHSVGGKAIMTSDSHDRASDRTAEAMTFIENENGEKVDIVVMVQGDEPMIQPSMIEESLAPFHDSSVQVVNLMSKIESVEEFEDPNEVKVVVDKNSNAMYFSREPIPSRKKGIDDVPMLKQVCIIPFRRDYLLKFNSMNETNLEIIESVDMMRILENGEEVRMVMTDCTSFSVDTLDDLKRVEAAMKNDPLMNTYIA